MNALADEYRAVLDPKDGKVEFALDTNQFREFANALSNTLYSPAFQIKVAQVSARPGSALDLFKKYYTAYIYDDFVDSRGTKLSKPQITARGIGNDTISTALIVLLEAVADSVLKTPVLCKKNPAGQCTAWLNAGKLQPTRAKVNHTLEEGVVDPGKCGVTEEEAQAITFLSELAADQAEFLSGMIVESFGGAKEVSFLPDISQSETTRLWQQL